MTVAGRELSLLVPPDSEALLDEDAFAADEFMPYWAELWPSGVLLAEAVDGVGRPGAGARLRARPAVARGGAGRGGGRGDRLGGGRGRAARGQRGARGRVAARCAAGTGRRDPAELGPPFDLVIAADVLYERRNVDALLARPAAPRRRGLDRRPGAAGGAGVLRRRGGGLGRRARWPSVAAYGLRRPSTRLGDVVDRVRHGVERVVDGVADDGRQRRGHVVGDALDGVRHRLGGGGDRPAPAAGPGGRARRPSWCRRTVVPVDGGRRGRGAGGRAPLRRLALRRSARLALRPPVAALALLGGGLHRGRGRVWQLPWPARPRPGRRRASRRRRARACCRRHRRRRRCRSRARRRRGRSRRRWRRSLRRRRSAPAPPAPALLPNTAPRAPSLAASRPAGLTAIGPRCDGEPLVQDAAQALRLAGAVAAAVAGRR